MNQIRRETGNHKRLPTIIIPPFLYVRKESGNVIMRSSISISTILGPPLSHLQMNLPHIRNVAREKRRCGSMNSLFLVLVPDPLRLEPEEMVQVRGKASQPHKERGDEHICS